MFSTFHYLPLSQNNNFPIKIIAYTVLRNYQIIIRFFDIVYEVPHKMSLILKVSYCLIADFRHKNTIKCLNISVSVLISNYMT